jgi:uncharacterized protein (TIGR01244 family)
MNLEITQHNPQFSTVGQINPEDVTQIVALGYKSIIDNRPDLEGGSAQPMHTDIEKKATDLGVQFAYLPVISGAITPEQVQQMADLLDALPKPILAFCRSGARSTNLYHLATSLR